MSRTVSTIYFYIPNQVTILDLSGVVQVFEEAKLLGLSYQLEFISNQTSVCSSSGLNLCSLKNYSDTSPTQNDILFFAGANTYQKAQFSENRHFFEWLRKANSCKTTICSICNGAFLLAKSGLLNNKNCTTHWEYLGKLKSEFPQLKIQKNTLFTQAENIYTSAGVITGIDLALHIIEVRHGNEIASKIAKSLVVYKRREASDSQESIYIQNRNHHDERIHKVQDWIIQNLDKASTIEELADLVFVSPRNLTRLFKKETGISISDYRTKLKVEKAVSLLKNSELKIEQIAYSCGYKTSKQLRIILEKQFKSLPSEIRERLS